MENAVEALKIAFAIMMFALALTISVSSFSNAKTAVDAIVTLRDDRTEYTYVKPSEAERIVGIESIIPTMYSAYNENFKVVFLKSDGVTPLPLYYELDAHGKVKEDEDRNKVTINYIDLELETHKNKTEAITHLDMLLGKKQYAAEKYKNEFMDDKENGLYEYLQDKKFKEYLGEYYQEDAIAGEETGTLEINKTKKRIVTYVLID